MAEVEQLEQFVFSPRVDPLEISNEILTERQVIGCFESQNYAIGLGHKLTDEIFLPLKLICLMVKCS